MWTDWGGGSARRCIFADVPVLIFRIEIPCCGARGPAVCSLHKVSKAEFGILDAGLLPGNQPQVPWS